MNKLIKFITKNLKRVLLEETTKTLGNRNLYIGASDIGGCPYKIVSDKLNPPQYSLKQQIIFQRGHLAENLVKKMLDGLNVVDQYEILGEIDNFTLKAHIDFLIRSKDRCVVIEAKTVNAPITEPYESWVMQVHMQMGLMLEKCNHEVEAYVLAIDLNSGWMETFKIDFDDNLFNLCLNKAQHIKDSLEGLCEPKAIVQNYCGSCHLKMSCPKQGKFAQDLPTDVKDDLVFIKNSKLMARESKLREKRVKEFLVNTGVKNAKDVINDTVVSVKEQQRSKFDIESFKDTYPELYEQFTITSSTHTMRVL